LGEYANGRILQWLIPDPEKFPYELYPSKEHSSYYQCSDCPIVQSPIVKFLANQMGKELSNSPREDFLEVDLVDEELAGMPNTALVIAGQDPWRDDGLFYTQRLHEQR
jgi:hypothetical protein